MPWTAESFRKRHNKGLTLGQADRAARIANALLEEGLGEGEAIATANARVVGKPRKRPKYHSTGKPA